MRKQRQKVHSNYISGDEFLANNHQKDSSYIKSSAIEWHKEEFLRYFEGREQHSKELCTNSNVMRIVKLYHRLCVVLHSSYNHICGIFGNVMVEVRPQSKKVECLNPRYKMRKILLIIAVHTRNVISKNDYIKRLKLKEICCCFFQLIFILTPLFRL